jgi:hypothetical protein
MDRLLSNYCQFKWQERQESWMNPSGVISLWEVFWIADA